MCARHILFCSLVCLTAIPAFADWKQVYNETFDRLPAGTTTASPALHNWESGSASGVVYDGKTDAAGRFLIATSAWTSFNQGPILNLDLSAVPHDRVRVEFDLYTFGDWRGLQRKTGGPQHRLMFFDNKAQPGFAFDTNFATDRGSQQSWPGRNPAAHKPLTGAQPVTVDSTGRFKNAHRWPIAFEYPSDSSALRFTMLCGAAAGSGLPMPHFGIDNVRVSVRSTAPTIDPIDRPEDIRLAKAKPIVDRSTQIRFQASDAERHSVGIFDRRTGRLVRTLLSGESLESGTRRLRWDGLDNRGQQVPAGDYEWRSLSSNGFTARYITTIGVNPPGGENPVPSKSWVGDHVGAGIVDVDSSGVYVGSPMTEGGRMILKCDPKMTRVEWTRPQFYQSGRLNRIATSGKHVFMVHPNGRLRRVNKETGNVEAEWQVGIDGSAPTDIDANDDLLVAVYPEKNLIRWLATADGSTLSEVSLPAPGSVTAIGSKARDTAFVTSGRDVFVATPGQRLQKAASLAGTVVALDYDAARQELWAVLDGYRVVRLDKSMKVTQTYGQRPRPAGPFDPTLFAGIYDIAADLQGGFFVGEPGHAPRRIAHFSRDGSLIDQWFGGMSFYVNATFDPDDPTRLFGIAPEGWVNVYQIDYDSGTWQVEAVYPTGRLGDGMFPNSGSFRAVRRNGTLYLYHRAIPAVLRLDPERRRAVPVAIAGRVLNSGRTFFQFAGTGRDGYPKPWVAAAEHHGYRDLKTAPTLYSWADTNGNGEFDPSEFKFYPKAKRGLSFHNPGDFTSRGDHIGSANVNEPHALLRLPVSNWEGPDRAAPRWNWDALTTAGEITADSYGYGSPRGVSVGPDDSVSVAYQAGIMIREHGQYEGGGWPEAALRGARVLGFDPRLRPTFSVGRQSKDGSAADSGVLYYPMQTTTGPNRSVIVNDQTKQPAQVWTHDGLYVGGFFDHRAEDGRPDGFYQLHGDDNQGATVVTDAQGRTFWLMPYQGHNRLYEITGWQDWKRQSGPVSRPGTMQSADAGKGLTARYYKGRQLELETVEPPIHYERFGAERHAKELQPHYKAVWTGTLLAPVTDRIQFRSLLGKNEQVAVWIDGHAVHSNGFQENINHAVDLTSGHRHNIRIEFINPDGRAELTLLWSSRTVDPQRLPPERLYPES